MKQLNYIFALLLAMLCGVNAAKAEIVQNYKVDFSKFVNVSAHDFKVGSSWGHIVGSRESGGTLYYPTYDYNTYTGHNGTGCLGCSDQTQVGPWSDKGSCTDILVTPKLKGKVGLWTLKKGYSGMVLKFYKVTKNGDIYTLGDEIQPVTAPTFSSYYTWENVELPELAEEQQIGIYLSNVNIDDFYADQADITKEAALYVKTVTSNGPSSPYCNAEGKFDVDFSVTLQNSGDLDLTPGTENYTLSLINESADATMFTVPINEAIAAGETKVVSLTGQVDGNAYPENNKYSVRENITNTQQYGTWLSPIQYIPKLEVRNLGALISSGATYSFNKINKKTTKEINIKNAGGAPMQNITITAPENFTVSATEPFTLTAGKDSTIVITALPDNVGDHSGNVTIKADDIDDFQFGVSSTVLDSKKFFVSFEDKKLPAGSYAEGSWTVEARDYAGSDNQYMLKNGKVGGDEKFVTPLLKVAEGDAITFDAGKASTYSSGDDAVLNVYYSNDRKNWTLARKINADELSSERANNYSYYFSKLTTFTVDNIPAGNWYLAFGAGYTTLDNIYGYEPVDVAHDMLYKGFEIQQTGSVNHAIEAKATFTNLNAKPEAAGSYTVKLYFGDKEMASAEPKGISAATDTTFVFDVMPHEVGTFKAYAVFENAADGLRLVSDSIDVTVEEETFKSTLTVGSGDGKTSSDGIYWDYADTSNGAYCDAIYPARMLKKYGLSAGSKIKSISMTGTFTSTYEKTLKVEKVEGRFGFVADADVLTDPCDFSVEGLNSVTLYENQSVDFKTNSNITSTFEFAEPLVWDGVSALRIQTYVKADKYATVYYKVDSEESHSYHKGYSLASNTNGNPIIEVALQAEPAALSGKVACGENAVADAVVTLRSKDDVVYTTKSADDGTFTINVLQPNKKYELTATAEGYDDFTATDSLTFDTDVEQNIAMVKTFVSFSGNATYRKAPLAGVKVTLSREGDEDLTATTAQDGTFKFDAVKHGQSYTLTATAEGYNDYAVAEPIAVGEEDYVLPTIEMTKPKATVSGVVACSGKAIEGAKVTLTTAAGDAYSQEATTDADGKFSMDVEQDFNYMLKASADRYEDYTTADSVMIDGTKDLGTVELIAKFFTLTVPETSYLMFSSKKAVDFEAEGLKAYFVTEVKAKGDDAYTELAEITKVPANFGVIIYAPQGEYELDYLDDAAAPETNLLVSTAGKAFDGTAADKGKVWAFGFKDEKPVFATGDNVSVAEGAAYLRFESTAKNIYLFEKDVPEVSGVSNVYGEGNLDVNAPMFNLAGQKVSKSYKGVVIQNGKKYNKK